MLSKHVVITWKSTVDFPKLKMLWILVYLSKHKFHLNKNWIFLAIYRIYKNRKLKTKTFENVFQISKGKTCSLKSSYPKLKSVINEVIFQGNILYYYYYFWSNVLETLFPQFGLYQIIHKPPHTLDTYSSCIGLFFTFQPNFVVESSVHLSLHSNCHHQIIFAKCTIHHPTFARFGITRKRILN